MDLDEIVDSYEQSFAKDHSVRLEDFVPEVGDPRRRAVLAELIRVDLELRWKRGIGQRLDDYRGRFPQEFETEGFVTPLAFEEYRVRLLLGDPVRRTEYSELWGCDVSDWPDESVGTGLRQSSGQHGLTGPGAQRSSGVESVERGLSGAAVGVESRPRSTDRLSGTKGEKSRRGVLGLDGGGRDPVARAIYAAQRELGFEIVEQLGQGASARVYLARQPSLANRLVVLKFTTESTVEADRLARLQHTNIVPIYSYHELGEMHVLCMPFVGRYVLKEWVDQLHVLGVAPEDNASLVTTLRHRAAVSWELREEELNETHSRLYDSRQSIDSIDRSYLESTSRLVQNPSREAGLLRLQGESYSETVLWIAARLASGMAHAHDHGILHLDIKPGNILITDEGQPMLLDFHLSTLRSKRGPENPLIGGTLPYMSPEQILAFQDMAMVDERSDIYSLGVVLYELMTGRMPFVTGRTGASREDLQCMLQVRTTLPTLVRYNRAISPAAEAIVLHCLAYRPEDRYQSAHELSHDLQCQLQHLPLRHASNPSWRELASKWIRRHPRVMSAGSIASLSVLGLGVLGTSAVIRGHKLAENEAERRFVEFVEVAPRSYAGLSLVKSNFAEASREVDTAVDLLDELGFPVRKIRDTPVVNDQPDNVQPTWRSTTFYQLLTPKQRVQLDQTAGEMLFLLAEVVGVVKGGQQDPREAAAKALAMNRLAILCFESDETPRAIWAQRARFYELRGEHEQAREARSQEGVGETSSALHERFEALSQLVQQDQQAAARSLEKLTKQSPQDMSLWFFSGNNHVFGHQLDEAEASYTACIALSPQWSLPWFQRGTIRMMGNQFEKAAEDFTKSYELNPRDLGALRNRALCLEALHRYEEALRDCTEAIQRGFPETRIHFLRAKLFDRLGRSAEAEADRREGLTRTPTDVESWIARGVTRMPQDPAGAEQDFREAIRWQPGNSAAHRNLALVLVEHLGRDEEALEVLDDFCKTQQVSDGLVWLGRGVLRARKGELAEARKDARRGLELNRQPIAVYQAACIEALDPNPTMDTLRRTMELLAEAFRGDPALISIAVTDQDLRLIQDKRLFKDLVSLMRFVSPKQ
ncbi:MAG: protein kinase domain-containing protein [Planctomycetaceae bacterium]